MYFSAKVLSHTLTGFLCARNGPKTDESSVASEDRYLSPSLEWSERLTFRDFDWGRGTFYKSEAAPQKPRIYAALGRIGSTRNREVASGRSDRRMLQ